MVTVPFAPPGRAAPRSTAEASIGPQRLALPGAPWRNSASRLPGPPSFRRGSGRRMHRDPRDPRGQRPSSARQEAGPGAGPRGDPQCWLVWVGPAARIPGGGWSRFRPQPPGLTAITTQAQTTLPRGLRGWDVAPGGVAGTHFTAPPLAPPAPQVLGPGWSRLRPGRLAAAHAQVQRTVHPNNHPPTSAF